jgi:hypothetical protein
MKLVLALKLLKSPWWVAFVEGGFVTFRSKVGEEMLNFEEFSWLEIKSKF